MYLDRLPQLGVVPPMRFDLSREGWLEAWARLRDNETRRARAAERHARLQGAQPQPRAQAGRHLAGDGGRGGGELPRAGRPAGRGRARRRPHRRRSVALGHAAGARAGRPGQVLAADGALAGERRARAGRGAPGAPPHPARRSLRCGRKVRDKAFRPAENATVAAGGQRPRRRAHAPAGRARRQRARAPTRPPTPRGARGLPGPPARQRAADGTLAGRGGVGGGPRPGGRGAPVDPAQPRAARGPGPPHRRRAGARRPAWTPSCARCPTARRRCATPAPGRCGTPGSCCCWRWPGSRSSGPCAARGGCHEARGAGSLGAAGGVCRCRLARRRCPGGPPGAPTALAGGGRRGEPRIRRPLSQRRRALAEGGRPRRRPHHRDRPVATRRQRPTAAAAGGHPREHRRDRAIRSGWC